MAKQFAQTVWNEQLQQDWQILLRLAIDEDLAEAGDWTTKALVPEDVVSRAAIVARRPGVIAGLPGVAVTLRQIEPRIGWRPQKEDGQAVGAGDTLGILDGPARGMLTAERLLLNFLGHLSGIATLTRQYVEAVAGTRTRIYDTRKTTPGWRRLEKYAVRCGGGWNHRSGLFDAVLIKDNHLALGGALPGATAAAAAEAVGRARRFVCAHGGKSGDRGLIVEVEVDTLEQLAEVLPSGPDLVLLDNMSVEQLRQAVACRDARNASIELEASGGVSLETVRAIAATGVDRISVGALTHSAPGLDVALDWL